MEGDEFGCFYLLKIKESYAGLCWRFHARIAFDVVDVHVAADFRLTFRSSYTKRATLKFTQPKNPFAIHVGFNYILTVTYPTHNIGSRHKRHSTSSQFLSLLGLSFSQPFYFSFLCVFLAFVVRLDSGLKYTQSVYKTLIKTIKKSASTLKFFSPKKKYLSQPHSSLPCVLEGKALSGRRSNYRRKELKIKKS